MEHITLGSTPASETCAQLGTPGYGERAISECDAYVGQLKRLFKAVHARDARCRLEVVDNPHDFGNYLEVHAQYHEDDKRALTDALWLDGHMPEEWDEEARKELNLLP